MKIVFIKMDEVIVVTLASMSYVTTLASTS